MYIVSYAAVISIAAAQVVSAYPHHKTSTILKPHVPSSFTFLDANADAVADLLATARDGK